jgi:uncharacterized phage protein (TIGR02220 family)
MSKRVKLTFHDDEWKRIDALCKSCFPFLPRSTAIRNLLLELADNKGAIQDFVTRGAFESPAVPSSHPESPGVPCPSLGVDQDLTPPDPARSEKNKRREEEEKKKKKKNSASRALAPLDLSERIISHLNYMAGTSYRHSGRKVRELIQARLNDGSSEADFIAAIDKMTRQWKGTDMEKYLRPVTLFGPKLDDYAGAPDVKPSTSNGRRQTKVERMTQQQQGFIDGEW